MPPDSADAFSLLLELRIFCARAMHRTSTAGTLVSRALHSMRSLQDREYEYMFRQCGAPAVLQSGSVGRPKFYIPEQQLSFLVESRFTGTQIAGIL